MANETKQPKVVGGINLSTRTKSKTFWVAIISAVAVFANQITGAFGLDYSAQIEQGVNIIGSILTLLAGLGIIVDNNTRGIKDSGIAQTYTKPRNENVDPVQFQAEVDYTRETFEDSNAEEVTESVDGLRDVDQEEIEEEEPEYLEVTEDPSVDNPDSAPLGSNSVETLELDKEAPKSLGDQTPKSKGGEVE